MGQNSSLSQRDKKQSPLMADLLGNKKAWNSTAKARTNMWNLRLKPYDVRTAGMTDEQGEDPSSTRMRRHTSTRIEVCYD